MTPLDYSMLIIITATVLAGVIGFIVVTFKKRSK